MWCSTCTGILQRAPRAVLAALLCTAVVACGGSDQPAPVLSTPAAEETAAAPAKKIDRFDEDRAWRMLEHQVKLGPRPAGSPQSKQLAAYIKARLPRSRYE